MRDSKRFKLRFGPYKTPLFRIGQIIQCALRGEVEITRISSSRISWPMGKPVGMRSGASLVVYKGLAKAVRLEANHTVRYWWGVAPCTVWKWRKALGVLANTKGTSALRKEYSQEEWFSAVRAKAHTKLGDPARRAKIAAAKRGKPRPKAVIAGMRARMLGKKLSEATRRKMSAAHKARGTRPPWLNSPWEGWEDELVRTLPGIEAAKQTGRSYSAVTARRSTRGLPDGRQKSERQRLGR
jgi:hypothetical protein